MSDLGDMLLYALSAWKETSWAAYKRVFGTLIRGSGHLDNEQWEKAISYERTSAALLLDTLGHCDVSFSSNGGKVFVTPSTLASIPTAGFARAVICGARSPETSSELVHACEAFGDEIQIEIKPQSEISLYAPSRIELLAETQVALKKFCQENKINFSQSPPAWAIAELSGSIPDYLDQLTWSSEPEVNWERSDFDITKLRFVQEQSNTTGYRLSKYFNPVHNHYVHRLWSKDLSANVDPGWGRYAVLQENETKVLYYNQKAGVLAVPRRIRLPRLLRRSLTLCSGFAPKQFKCDRMSIEFAEPLVFEAYPNIPFDLIETVASKLGQAGICELPDSDVGGIL